MWGAVASIGLNLLGKVLSKKGEKSGNQTQTGLGNMLSMAGSLFGGGAGSSAGGVTNILGSITKGGGLNLLS